MLRCINLFILSVILFPAAFAGDELCCDFRDDLQKYIKSSKQCQDGAIEIASDIPANIQIGYGYISQAPAYITISGDCPAGTVLPIVAVPLGVDARDPSSPKIQVCEFICGSVAPYRIAFDFNEGSREFSYFKHPQPCEPYGCTPGQKDLP